MMSNDEVITMLESILAEYDERIEELKKLELDPGGEPHERADRLDDIYAQQATLATRRHHVRNRLRMRKLQRDLGAAVPPLSAVRVEALNDALQRVGRSLQAAATFDTALAIAASVATAAGDAARASRV